jgi:hypothetical protein
LKLLRLLGERLLLRILRNRGRLRRGDGRGGRRLVGGDHLMIAAGKGQRWEQQRNKGRATM